MLIVKKFGGTSVANKERIFNVAGRCIEEYKKGNDVVVVLSAMGKYTDELITMAKDINEKPPKREMDMLFTIGEQMSVALMAMAFDKLGIPSVSLNAFQVAMHTTSVHGNARLKRIDTERIKRELENHKIVVVTGFQGINKYDDYTTLGRGGSDTTAVALAAVLHADACEIYTDVDGVYTADPRLVPTARKLESISYDEMLDLASLGAGVLHNRSVEMAKKYGVLYSVLPDCNKKDGLSEVIFHTEAVPRVNMMIQKLKSRLFWQITTTPRLVRSCWKVSAARITLSAWITALPDFVSKSRITPRLTRRRSNLQALQALSAPTRTMFRLSSEPRFSL